MNETRSTTPLLAILQDTFARAIDSVLQDARFALRTLGRSAGSTVAAILVLAAGIGATTALFSTVNGVLLKPVPFEDSNRLVVGLKTRNGRFSGPVSRLDYFDYRDASHSFENLAALGGNTLEQTVTGAGRPELVQSAFVTWNLFRTLEVAPTRGREFLPEEEARGGANVAIISYGLWQRRFGGDNEAIGRVLTLDGTPLTVVGVMPSRFHFYYDVDVWRLIDCNGPWDLVRDSHSHELIGRLAPGVSREQAQHEADSIFAGLERRYPDTNKGKGLMLVGLHDYLIKDARSMLLLLLATTVLVLLIACANVTGLLLARGQRRLAEMAMRTALGASRARLVRQLLTESIILTVLAGLAGIAAAYGFQRLLLQLVPLDDSALAGAGIDPITLLFALGLSTVTGLAVGIVPAIRASAVELSERLKSGTHASEGREHTRVRSGLVIAQVGISIVLLIGSGLLVRSLIAMATVDPGFEPSHVLTGQVKIQGSQYPGPQQRAAFFDTLLGDIRRLPGVVSAATVNKMPIRDRFQDWGIWPADEAQPSPEDTVMAMARWVSPGYFHTIGIPFLSGRDINVADRPGARQVIVISKRVADRVFPDRDPVGRTVKVMFVDGDYEVIGVVGDARLNYLTQDPEPALYLSAAQIGATRLQLAIRIATSPTAFIEPIRRLLEQKDPNVVFARPEAMSSVVRESLAGSSAVAWSAASLAVLALLLAVVGLYGVLAYQVSQRSAEIGIRIAIGASRGDVLRLVLRRGVLLVGSGVIVGLAGAAGASRLITSLMFQTTPLDPPTYACAALILALVSMMACLLPAWRATQVDPVEVLRKE